MARDTQSDTDADSADEAAGLEAILEDTRAQGLRYISDAHARGAGAAYPEASLWDNGADPVAHLEGDVHARGAAVDQLDPVRQAPVPQVAHHQRPDGVVAPQQVAAADDDDGEGAHTPPTTKRASCLPVRPS